MNGAQGVITLSYGVVAGYLGLKHAWGTRGLAWLRRPAGQDTASETPSKVGPLTDVQAGVISYTALLIGGATELAPIAEALAVTVGVITAMKALDILYSRFPRAFAPAPLTVPKSQQAPTTATELTSAGGRRA